MTGGSSGTFDHWIFGLQTSNDQGEQRQRSRDRQHSSDLGVANVGGR
jgi:hypothetical protein